jgi:hypothetical protein
METEKELSKRILSITLYIRQHYPELGKYLDEMPITIPDENDPNIDIKNLNDYLESLNNLCSKYGIKHPHN